MLLDLGAEGLDVALQFGQRLGVSIFKLFHPTGELLGQAQHLALDGGLNRRQPPGTVILILFASLSVPCFTSASMATKPTRLAAWKPAVAGSDGGSPDVMVV